MGQSFKEPALDDVIGDPIVRAVMRRDAVEERDLRRLIARVRDTLGSVPAMAPAKPDAPKGLGLR